MKTLIASIALFVILIIIIIGNVLYVNYVTNEIRRYTEQLCIGGDSEPIEELTSFWRTNKKYVALSISHEHLDSLSELIIKLEGAYKAGNTATLETTKQLIFDDLAGITRFEKISIENIL